MDQQIEMKVASIKQAFHHDPAIGAANLVDFALEYASDNKQIHQALLLKMNLMDTQDEQKKSGIMREMLQLLDRIGELAFDKQALAGEVKTDPTMMSNTALTRSEQVVCKGKGIWKTFRKGGFTLKDLNFEFRLGEITGVVGENGNGKTSLFRIVVGELAMDKGILSFPFIQRDQPFSSNHWDKIKKQIAFIPQDLERWYGSVRANLHYELALHGIKGKENDEEVDYIIYRMGLESHQSKSWSQLSGGYKLRFALARALVWKPQLLVIDEPLANLDIKAQLVILNDLRDLANSYKHPLSIVISSQHLHEIENVSDNIIFLKEGTMVFNGKMSELGKERQENSFELASAISLEELERKLAGFNYYSIEHTGLEFIIHTPLSVTDNELLTRLIQEGVRINYFRNISQSTKKLFV